jgi:hypothetical protein
MSGVFIGLVPPREVAELLAVPGGDPIEPGDAIVLTDEHGWVLAGCA